MLLTGQHTQDSVPRGMNNQEIREFVVWSGSVAINCDRFFQLLSAARKIVEFLLVCLLRQRKLDEAVTPRAVSQVIVLLCLHNCLGLLALRMQHGHHLL